MVSDKTLKTIHLKNFMCYKRPTEFAFQPGVNAIIGANDQGKSTILAAIGWVVTGKPAGDTVESWDGDRDVAVELHFADGTMVGRYREKGQNRYETLHGRTKGKYRAIGNNVPDEVSNLLALEDINFQGQANNLYPMQLTAGEFGAVVNRHCRLDEIHTTMKRISSEMRGWEKETNRQQAAIDDCTMRLEDLKWVAKAEGMVVAAEQMQASVRRLESTVAEGRKLLSQLVEEHQVLYEQKKLVEALSVRTETARGLYNNKNELETKIEVVEKYSRELGLKRQELAWAERILQTEESIQECRMLWKHGESTRSTVERGDILLAQLDSLNKALMEQRTAADFAKEKIQEIRDNLPPVCPLCGQVIVFRRKK
jgi:DNA repair ATPase RecN